MFKVATRTMMVVTVPNSKNWRSSVKMRSKWDRTLITRSRYALCRLFSNSMFEGRSRLRDYTCQVRGVAAELLIAKKRGNTKKSERPDFWGRGYPPWRELELAQQDFLLLAQF